MAKITLETLNRLLAQVIFSLAASVRFDRAVRRRHRVPTNLVFYPRFHFVLHEVVSSMVLTQRRDCCIDLKLWFFRIFVVPETSPRSRFFQVSESRRPVHFFKMNRSSISMRFLPWFSFEGRETATSDVRRCFLEPGCVEVLAHAATQQCLQRVLFHIFCFF